MENKKVEAGGGGLKQEKGGVGAVCGGGEVFSSDSI